MDELRSTREDINDLYDAIGRAAVVDHPTSVVARVVTDSATDFPVWVKAKVVSITGTPAEGTAPGTVESDSTIDVAIIGPTTPEAGDVVVARLIAGRWVGETCCGEDIFPCGIYCGACGGVYLLRGGTITDDNGTYPLILWMDGNPSVPSGLIPQWSTDIIHGPVLPRVSRTGPYGIDCIFESGATPYILGVGCGPGGISFVMATPGTAYCPILSCNIGYYHSGLGDKYDLNWRTVNGTYAIPATSVSCADGVLTASATWEDYHFGGCNFDLPSPTRNVSVSIPLVGLQSGVCCQWIYAISPCSNTALADKNIPNTFTILDPDDDTVLFEQTTTTGYVNATWSGPCNVKIRISNASGRFDDYEGTHSFTRGGRTDIPLVVAGGYYCYSENCAYPAPTTLHGLVTLAFGDDLLGETSCTDYKVVFEVTLEYDSGSRQWKATKHWTSDWPLNHHYCCGNSPADCDIEFVAGHVYGLNIFPASMYMVVPVEWCNVPPSPTSCPCVGRGESKVWIEMGGFCPLGSIRTSAYKSSIFFDCTYVTNAVLYQLGNGGGLQCWRGTISE